MLAPRRIGVRKNHNVPISEPRSQSRVPPCPRALTCGCRDKATLAKVVDIFLALAKIDNGVDWSRDQFRQAVRYLRALRLPRDPFRSLQMKLWKLLFRCFGDFLADFQIRRAVSLSVDKLRDKG